MKLNWARQQRILVDPGQRFESMVDPAGQMDVSTHRPVFPLHVCAGTQQSLPDPHSVASA